MEKKEFLAKLAATCEESRKAFKAYQASPEYLALQDGLEQFGVTLKAIYTEADFDTMLESEKLILFDDLERANSPEEVKDLQLAKKELEGAVYVLGLIKSNQESYRTLIADSIRKKDFRKDGTPIDSFRAFLNSQRKRINNYLEASPSPAHTKIYYVRKDILKELEHQYKLMQRNAMGLEK